MDAISRISASPIVIPWCCRLSLAAADEAFLKVILEEEARRGKALPDR